MSFRTRRIAAATAFALLATTALAQPEAVPTNVDVTQVTLATGGLAQVEGRMAEPGEAMRMAVERGLVADVLRTLVITGPAPVRSIDLEAAEAVGERSTTGRLLNGDLSNPETILQSLIGESVEVRGGAVQLTGRLLSFTPLIVPGSNKVPEKPALRIAVATEDGRVAFATFETMNALAIEGSAVRERVDGVVPALRESVDDGRRELTVRLDASAQAGFSFVVPTTVWRPSYRAIVGTGSDVELQGWATLENTTGLDWNDINLRLAVGTPVAYAQDVYSPLRTSRPSAPFEVGRTAEVPLIQQDAPAVMELEAAGTRYSRQRMGGVMAMAAPAPSPPADMADRARLITGGPAQAGSAATIFPVAGEIDLAAGRTLTVPFLDGSDEAERIVFLTVGGNQTPMDALELSFDAEATVPGGLIAVYDDTGFVGDARFAGADGGERTILPFAVSSDVNVRITQNQQYRLSRAQIVDGTLRLRRDARRQIVLAMEASEPVTAVIDLPTISGEDIAADASAPVELSTVNATLTRVRVDLPAGSTRLDLPGERPISESYMVSNIPTAVIEEVLSTGGAVDAQTAERLRRVAASAARIAEIDRRINTLDADVADLRVAVESDRENLDAINVSTPEGARIRERLIERTDRIDEALAMLRDLRRERLEEERALRNP
ncbi:MAG: DUF4139 domain-containing protein [Pseudomonadota bacterium]